MNKITHCCSGSVIMASFFDTSSGDIFFYDLIYGQLVLWSSLGYPTSEDEFRSLGLANEFV